MPQQGLQLYADAAGVVTALATGAITGDETTPRQAITIAPLHYLTTGSLPSIGSTGDVSMLAAFTIECWFQTDNTSPAGGDVLISGPTSGGGGLFQYWLAIGGGNVSINARNSVATTFGVATAISTNTWYHVVGTITGGRLRLYLNGVEVGSSVAWSGVFGVLDSSTDFRLGDNSSVATMSYDEVAFYRRGLAADRIAAHYQAGAQRGFATQLSGARVQAALDTASSQAPRRLMVGVRSIIPRFMRGQPPLDSITEAVSGEAVEAAFFVGAGGTTIFLDSSHRSSSPYNTVQATFGDAAGELAYVDLDLDYSDSFLANEWDVTRSGTDALTQTASDATSIARYAKRPQSIAGVPVPADSDASTIASALLAKTKDPMLRITSLTFSTLDPNVAEALFRRELMDKITIKRTPPGGGARISQDLYIQKIEISGANDGAPWTVRWAVSPV